MSPGWASQATDLGDEQVGEDEHRQEEEQRHEAATKKFIAVSLLCELFLKAAMRTACENGSLVSAFRGPVHEVHRVVAPVPVRVAESLLQGEHAARVQPNCHVGAHVSEVHILPAAEEEKAAAGDFEADQGGGQDREERPDVLEDDVVDAAIANSFVSERTAEKTSNQHSGNAAIVAERENDVAHSHDEQESDLPDDAQTVHNPDAASYEVDAKQRQADDVYLASRLASLAAALVPTRLDPIVGSHEREAEAPA